MHKFWKIKPSTQPMYAHAPVMQLHVCVNVPQEVGMRHTVLSTLNSLCPYLFARLIGLTLMMDSLTPSLNVNFTLPQACHYISFTCSWESVQFLLCNIVKFLILHGRKISKSLCWLYIVCLETPRSEVSNC